MLAMDMPAMTPAHHGPSAAVRPELPWALEKAAPPLSASPSMSMPTPGGARGIGLDAAVARFDALGLPRPFSVTLPEGPRGAYVGDYRPDRVQDSRTVYLDHYDGRVLGDVGFARWGAAAQAIEWGIAVHQGQQYGPLNRYLMLTGCVAIVLLAALALEFSARRLRPGLSGAKASP
jgi:uncharacterized iron-regulated membrane protein